jgi:hypothetical protein
MSGDDLAICLFLVGLGATFGLEAMKAETTPRRMLFGILGGVFLLTGIAWLQVKPLWPPLTTAVSTIATNPVSWFVVAMFALAIIAFQPRKRPPNSTAQSVSDIVPTLPSAKPKPQASKLAAPPDKRDFVDVTPEYLLNLRNQKDLTEIQTDLMLKPFLGNG